MVLQPTVELQVGGLKFGRPAIVWSWLPGHHIWIRTADLRDHDQLHYHSTTACCAALVLSTVCR